MQFQPYREAQGQSDSELPYWNTTETKYLVAADTHLYDLKENEYEILHYSCGGKS